jgi:hypothetical protein
MRTLVPRTMVAAITMMLLTACESALPSTPLAPTGSQVDKDDGNTGGLVVEGTQIQLLESYPVQVRLVVEGTLPTPCHGLEYQVSEPTDEGHIDVTLRAIPGDQAFCDQVITPFEEIIPVGKFTEGAFIVWLNGERVQEFNLGASAPTPSSGEGVEGLVYVDRADILMLESFPVQVELVVEGNKPTPCHELRWEVSDPDATGRIDVKLSSTIPPDVMCVQVLEAFEAHIPLGSFETGSFSVWLNGERVGEFEL